MKKWIASGLIVAGMAGGIQQASAHGPGDALGWALGGAVVGALVGTAVANSGPVYQQAYVAPAPAPVYVEPAPVYAAPVAYVEPAPVYVRGPAPGWRGPGWHGPRSDGWGPGPGRWH